MMSSRIIHYGKDECKRLLVLRSAGFAVEDCTSYRMLRSALGKMSEAAAVVISDDDVRLSSDAITLVRSRSHSPLVLFQSVPDFHSISGHYDESQFDLIIPVLTNPRDWLQEITALVERSRALCESSKSLQAESALLRKTSGEVREKSLTERKRAAHARPGGLPESRKKA